MNGDVTAAHYLSSSTVDSTRIMNSAQADYNSDVRYHHNIRAQPQHGGEEEGIQRAAVRALTLPTDNKMIFTISNNSALG